MALVAKAFQDIITFSRATQTGTYVNSNGYITNSSVLNYLTYSNQPENAAWTKSNSFVQQNLLTYSQELDNAAWSKAGVTVAGADINATIAPDGTLTADKISEDTTTGVHWVFQSITTSATAFTASVYLKAAERTWGFIRLRDSIGNDRFAWFNLATGTVGTVQTNLTASIVPAANGFYRCIATISAATAAANPCVVGVATADNVNSYTGTTGSGIYAWGAQLVQGSVPGDYRATTSAALPCLYADYNGALRARKLSETAVTNVHLLQNNVATVGASQVVSVYAKAAERSQLYLQVGTTGAYFNLSTGAIVSGSGATITLVRDGWYRCEVSASPVLTNTNVFVAVANGGVNSYAGDGSSGIYIADAQLNDGSSALAYYDTTQYAYNAPRFDYDPVTRAPRGLLIEEQRTNLLLYSEQFDNAAWTKGGATVTANSTTSPDGTVDADTLTEDTSTGDHRAFQAVTVSNTTAYAFSVFVKPNGRSLVTLTFAGVGEATYNVSTGVVTNTALGTAEIQNAGNGWYRCILRFTTATTSYNAQIRLVSTGTTTSYTGDGTSGIFLWGAQLEAGAFATSYIPTVASQVTRAADVASVNTLSPWFNSVAGTIFAQINIGAKTPASYGIYSLDDGTTNNALPSFYGTAALQNSRVAAANVFTSTSSAIATTPAVLKEALAYANADYAASFNGGAPTTQLSGAIPSGINRLQIGLYNNQYINGHIQRITYYPRRLTNAELQTLTTL